MVKRWPRVAAALREGDPKVRLAHPGGRYHGGVAATRAIRALPIVVAVHHLEGPPRVCRLDEGQLSTLVASAVVAFVWRVVGARIAVERNPCPICKDETPESGYPISLRAPGRESETESGERGAAMTGWPIQCSTP